jgi:hypothetical protein
MQGDADPPTDAVRGADSGRHSLRRPTARWTTKLVSIDIVTAVSGIVLGEIVQ